MALKAAARTTTDAALATNAETGTKAKHAARAMSAPTARMKTIPARVTQRPIPLYPWSRFAPPPSLWTARLELPCTHAQASR